MNKWSNVTICLALLLVRLPPFNLFSSILFSTHNIARFLFVVSSLFLLVKHKFRINRSFEVLLLVLLLVFISLSIITASNPISFLSLYKNVAMAIIISIIYSSYRNDIDIRMLTFTLFLSIITNVVIELSLFVKIPLAESALANLANSKYLLMFNYQLGRGRMFGDTLDEAFLPILFMLLTHKNKNIRALSILGIGSVLFTVLISGWRSKILICMFEMFIGMAILSKKKIALIIGSIVICFVLFSFIPTNKPIGQNSIDRFSIGENESVKTLKTRLDYWSSSIKMWSFSPFLGVGLGNYFDNLSIIEKNNNIYAPIGARNKTVIIDDPHNIFFSLLSSCGGVTALVFAILVLKYLFDDINFFKYYSRDQQALSLSYWGFFLYSLFNPWLNFYFVTTFLLTRCYLYVQKKT